MLYPLFRGGIAEARGWLFEGLESQQFVAVVLILFSAQGDLSGQATPQIVDQGIKAIYATPPFTSFSDPL